MTNTDKISACFLCLRNVEKKKAGHGYSNCNGDGNVDYLNCESGDIFLLKRFLSWSLDLPPAVIGDLLCANVGAGDEHGENLLCGSCKMEMGAACQLSQDLAKKLMELQEILENSVKRVSDKLNANLHQKVAKQLNRSFGSSKEGGRRVQRLRDLLALKLATAKTKRIQVEVEVTGGNRPGVSGNGTSETEIEEFQDLQQGVHHENRKPNELNEPETEAVSAIVKVESDQGEANGVDETVEENEAMDLSVAKDNGDHRHGGSNSTSASTATKGKEDRGIVVDVERPFTCLNSSESFRDTDSVRRHQQLCKPMISSANWKPTPIPTTSKKTKMKPVEPGNGNGRFLRDREDVYIDVNVEERCNSSAVAGTDDNDDVPIECLRCNDRFNTIQEFKNHQWWCTPLKVQDLQTRPGSAKERLGRVSPYSGPGYGRNLKDSKRLKTVKMCRFCKKIFRDNHDLKRHERIHTGVKPFQCSKCKRRFNRYSSCKRHLEICKVGKTRPDMKNGNEGPEAISPEVGHNYRTSGGS